MKPYVVVSPEGLYYVGLHANESDAWQIAIGWPSQAEIEDLQQRGWYCAEGNVTWKKPNQSER